MYATSFSFNFYGHMFISLQFIRVLLKKRNRRDEKEANKMKNKFMIQLLEACVSLFITNASLVPFQFSFLSKKHSYFTFLQTHILKKGFIIIRLQIIPKATVI